MSDDDWVCGEAYDHRLRLISERDGFASYECRECGAEIFEESDPQPADGPGGHGDAAGPEVGK